jgi:ATP-dependent DNA ligase
MRKGAFEPCIPTRGTKVPAGLDWFHEIKHDRYRLIVQREGHCVRLLTLPSKSVSGTSRRCAAQQVWLAGSQS